MESSSCDIARYIWEQKYRYRPDAAPAEAELAASWRRVARAVASVESGDPLAWAWRFESLLNEFRFLPGGRILAGAGTGLKVTLFNCFVMGPIPDSLAGIFDALKEGALTMQQGGGVGYDFSSLRPRGLRARGASGYASGPVSFMRIWDSMCAAIQSTGARRGAMMATLRCDHPDIEDFIEAKRDPRELRHFNLSVLVSDAFMEAVRADSDWPLVFPEPGSASDKVSAGSMSRVVRARDLWQRVLRANYDCAEPGVLFIDRINRQNNLHYCETLGATNPCGEIPLPAYGACNLGSLNLTRFVRRAFTSEAALDWHGLWRCARLATRFLDNVIDLSPLPLAAQAEQVRASRRIGLGLTGLADALVMLNLHYASPAARAAAERAMATIACAAYAASADLAREKGCFPSYQAEPFLAAPFVARLPESLRRRIRARGLRNSHLLAIAPTGTISLLAGNVSSGVEPIFRAEHERRVLASDGSYRSFHVQDYAARYWRERLGRSGLPPCWVTAEAIAPVDHLRMQAVLQAQVDNAISKTIQVAPDIPFMDFARIYDLAYELGLKGCTSYRPNAVTGAVLTPGEADEATACCGLDREGD